MIYKYIDINNANKLLETDSIGELIDSLYDEIAILPSESQIISNNLPATYLSDVKKEISKYRDKIPLYDIASNMIYLVHRENVYVRITDDNYRFIDDTFYVELLENEPDLPSDIFNAKFLSNYNLITLQKTYMKIFYESFVLNSYITNCQRPSYRSGMKHIKPYYSTRELYYLGIDWELINVVDLSESELRSLCKKIIKYDIPAETLTAHQTFIYDKKAIGLVKHYSLNGSYYINRYLRETKCCIRDKQDFALVRNPDLENQIKLMNILVTESPAFLTDHTVYRFIESDKFMSYLKVGDVYTDPSFMSTTRNPFYYQENYAFGHILLKIKIPSNIVGIGLSVESYSNFPLEEEIILPPTSRFRLDKIIENSENNENNKNNESGKNTNGIIQKEKSHNYILNKYVKKKYEFTWVGNDYIDNGSIDISIKDSFDPTIQMVNFTELLSDINIKYTAMGDRLKYFRDTYLNVNNQFKCNIGQTEYLFNIQSYDSTTVYKPYYYLEVPDGICITTTNPKYGNINLIIELGSDIHVNYYFKYSVNDKFINLDSEDWIYWLSTLAYVLGSKSVIIHSDYHLIYNKNDKDNNKVNKTRYTYSDDIYQYLNNKKKRFDKFIEITPRFDYSQLEYLTGINTFDIIKNSDRNELYKIAKINNLSNIKDLYIYVMESDPKMISVLEEKIYDIYNNPELNPIDKISYNLDILAYLYNRSMIKQIPSDKEFVIKKGSFRKLIGDKKIVQFQNRLRTFIGDK